MNTRSTRSTVRFSNSFTLPGYAGELPAGDYEIQVEEELIPGLSFEAYRRTATYLTVRGRGANAGRTEWRTISDEELRAALHVDQAAAGIKNNSSDAALFSQEDPK